MSGYLKSTAPPEFVQRLDELETQSGRGYENLKLLSYERGLASWAVATKCVEVAEQQMAQYGQWSPEVDGAMIHLGINASLLIDWIRKHGRAGTAGRNNFRWERRLSNAAADGLAIASQYQVFLGCFPDWHRDRAVAEVIGQCRTRFTRVGGAERRRVRAFLQGRRSERTAIKPGLPDTPELRAGLEKAVRSCKVTSPGRFTYPLPFDLLEYQTSTYLANFDSIFRRDEAADLGGYTLRQFKRFYAALLAVCATHEILCFEWAQRHRRYPLACAVLVKQRRTWIDVVQRLSSLTADIIERVLADLAFPDKPRDMFVHPFLPLDSASKLLAVAPHFPLKSRPEDNILRVCSYRRPQVYDLISRTKEEEMLADLLGTMPRRFRATGLVKLPEPLPDLDCIVEDLASSTLVLAELKWVRKPIGLERFQRDEEVLKGVRQLAQVQQFFQGDPDYLFRHGKISVPLLRFEKVQYLLVARDHLVWVDPAAGYPLVEYETFKKMLQNCSDLRAGVEHVLTYDWLPVEGRDFEVRYDEARANGVVIESEVFYPLTGAQTAGVD